MKKGIIVVVNEAKEEQGDGEEVSVVGDLKRVWRASIGDAVVGEVKAREESAKGVNTGREKASKKKEKYRKKGVQKHILRNKMIYFVFKLYYK